MSEVVTPTTPEVTPAPVATPTAVPAPADVAPAVVTLTKEEHDQLARDAARARSNQSKAAKYDALRRNGSIKTFDKKAATTTPVDDGSTHDDGSAEEEKVKTGLLQIALDPQYRELFDADPTLRQIISSNPLGLLPVYAPEAVDAEDALELIKEAFEDRKTKLKPATPPVEPMPQPAPSVPPAGAINPSDNPVNKEYEEARKNPNTEQALAGMIRTGLKNMGNK